MLRGIYYHSSSKTLVKYLRQSGIEVGENVIFRHPRSVRIDVTRPSLVSIGDNVDMNKNFQILTHDWVSGVFRNCFGDMVNSSGKVTIGNNVYFGTDVIVLKGVTIGDNCVIGAGSIVTKDIPSNSVATGSPCRVVCDLQQYYEKRKKQALSEAVEYVNSIRERFNREPIISEMREEFIYFVDKRNIEQYKDVVPVKYQLGRGYDEWLSNHHAPFTSFEEFLDYTKK